MAKAEFADKFIAFVDILGFKNLVQGVEQGTGLSLAELFEIMKKLGDVDVQRNIEKYGPSACPQAPRIDPKLDFQITQISDCVVVSAEVSPQGIINLIAHCWSACFGLLIKGVLCRGYITRGSIYHTENQFIGTGYINAYLGEGKVSAFKRDDKDTGTPFIEVDKMVVEYINSQSDKTVKDVFKNLVISDGKLTVLFPFKRLSHSFMIGSIGGYAPKFDPQKEKQSNNTIRKGIISLKEKTLSLVDQADEKAMRKVEHYIGLLDKQLVACDQLDSDIDNLSRPYGVRATKENLPGLFRDD